MAIDGLDPLPPVAELLENLAGALEGQARDEELLRPESAEIALPVELELRPKEDGRLMLGMSPPTQWITTSVMPVWHGLRIRVDVVGE